LLEHVRDLCIFVTCLFMSVAHVDMFEVAHVAVVGVRTEQYT
jgi:hypothetical protein